MRHTTGRLLSLRAAALAALLGGCLATPSPLREFCILSVEETAGGLAIIDAQGHVRKRLVLGERPHEIAVSPDGRTAFVSLFGITDYDTQIGTAGASVARIDLATVQRTVDYVLPFDVRGPHGVKLRPRHRELFVNAEVGGDTMLVFDIATARLLRRFVLPAGTHNFVFSNDGALLFSFAGAKGVSKLDAATGRILAIHDAGSPVRGLLVAADGNVLASAKGAVVELRASDLGEVRRWQAPRPGQFVYLDQLADGSIVAPSLADGGVTFFPANGTPPHFVATGKTPIFARRGPDGRVYVANVEDDHISVIGSDGVIQAPIGGLTSPNGLGFGICPG